MQRWIVAALRHRRFFSLAELNRYSGAPEALNQRPSASAPLPGQPLQELDPGPAVARRAL